MSQGSQSRLQVVTNMEMQNNEAVRLYRQAAEDAWHSPNHKGWMVVQEQLVSILLLSPPIELKLTLDMN